ncbi:MAG: hypothetical protein M1827_005585 [Pycnora praestabilis]|nr:MAG: hypothetical protein M1827_005585 [Pycnora praestabilis]
MSLFLTSLILPNSDSERDTSEPRIRVAYTAPGATDGKKLELPLEPPTSDLDEISVTMHKSPTAAYDMGSGYNSWFSQCFGYDVVLAYLGKNTRPVLGNLSPNATNRLPNAQSSSGWLSSITNSIAPVLSSKQDLDAADDGITFADVAPFLVVTETSLKDVSSRLPPSETFDWTKFRPNIILSDAPSAYDEDFWGELSISSSSDNAANDFKIILTANCARCQSINIDYATGKPGKGEQGAMLKKLMKDRRVDAGTKYSPVFGRYGFVGKNGVGKGIKVDDEVIVSRRNEERTKFGECDCLVKNMCKRRVQANDEMILQTGQA